MSAKWRRAKQREREHIPVWAWPARIVLRALSSVTLGVILLSLVIIYATLASVPIGLLALIPTVLIDAATLLATIVLVLVVGYVLLRPILNRAPPVVRAAGYVLITMGLVAGAGALWVSLLWPVLRYDPGTGDGFRLFTSFIEANKSTTLRRLPILEMSELEFYSWWPMRLILLTFVLNMCVATIRRIEFTFHNLGVLTVHTGIVTMALGSLYYKSLKREGDVLLITGTPDQAGEPTPGPIEDAFYDNTRVALWLRHRSDQPWEQRPLTRIPRYNDYNIGVVGRAGPEAPATDSDHGRTLSIPVRDWRRRQDGPALPDEDLSFRVVGYASYAEPALDFVPADPPPEGQPPRPYRQVLIRATFPGQDASEPSEPMLMLDLFPTEPPRRVVVNQMIGIEYAISMPEDRWRALAEPVPEGTRHALVVQVPGDPGGFRAVYPVHAGSTVQVGQTGYSLEVTKISPEPPFPIITPGYRGATSSVAVVRVTTPDGDSYSRWIYHRFPEISQDLLEGSAHEGMPARRAADPAIQITFLDLDRLQVYLNEDEDEGGTVRAIVRLPNGTVREQNVDSNGLLEDLVPRMGEVQGPKLDLELGRRWANAEQVERPAVVPADQRQSDLVGTHSTSMLAVEIASWADRGSTPTWTKTVWLPFTRYLGVGMGTERAVNLPDGRQLGMAFGRQRHPLPGFAIRLVDFQMLSYDHRGSPRDYQSVVGVRPSRGQFEPFVHVTRLNYPLQAPFWWRADRPWLTNVAGRIASRLNPNQFKFSQNGWDQEGWARTRALADQGQIPRPFARFTILGVGNNPGIHMVALGGILMALGTPWAFYVKPWLVRRRKRKIVEELAATREAEADADSPGTPDRAQTPSPAGAQA